MIGGWFIEQLCVIYCEKCGALDFLSIIDFDRELCATRLVVIVLTYTAV